MDNGAFFTTPEQVLAAEEQARAQGFGQAAGVQNTMLAGALGNLGYNIAGALGGAFGAQMPQSAAVKQAQAVQEYSKGIDFADRQSVISAAKRASDAGQPGIAAQLMQLAPKAVEEKLYDLAPGARLVTATGEERARGLPKERASRRPIVRNFPEGDWEVAKQYNEATGEWEELSRGRKGSERAAGIAAFPTLLKQYNTEIKPLKEKLRIVDDAMLSAREGGDVATKALQASMAELFGGQTRAVAELNRWNTWGSVDERVLDSAKQFFGGTHTDETRRAALRFIKEFADTNIRPAWERENESFTKAADYIGVAPESFIRDAPVYKRPDFTQMSVQELVSTDLGALDIDERQALEDRIDQLLEEVQ